MADNVVNFLRPARASQYFDPGLFPEVDCQPCGKRQLAHGDVVDDELVYVCFSCGQVGPLAGRLDVSALELKGLHVAAPGPIEPPLPKKKGCSKSCGKNRSKKAGADEATASSGGCGSCTSCSSGGCK